MEFPYRVNRWICLHVRTASNLSNCIAFFLYSQTGICKGTVLRMGKGFNLQGIDGQDLATLFSDACKRKVHIFFISDISTIIVIIQDINGFNWDLNDI